MKGRYKYTGFSSIGMVMILAMLGFLLVSGFNNYFVSWRKAGIYQTQYYFLYNQSISSIEWSISQTWRDVSEQWQCKTEPSMNLQACIKLASRTIGNFVIIKGISEQFVLYHLATYQKNLSGVTLSIQAGHWLDYCPEPRSVDCE